MVSTAWNWILHIFAEFNYQQLNPVFEIGSGIPFCKYHNSAELGKNTLQNSVAKDVAWMIPELDVTEFCGDKVISGLPLRCNFAHKLVSNFPDGIPDALLSDHLRLYPGVQFDLKYLDYRSHRLSGLAMVWWEGKIWHNSVLVMIKCLGNLCHPSFHLTYQIF